MNHSITLLDKQDLVSSLIVVFRISSANTILQRHSIIMATRKTLDYDANTLFSLHYNVQMSDVAATSNEDRATKQKAVYSMACGLSTLQLFVDS